MYYDRGESSNSHLDSPSLWIYVGEIDSVYEKALNVGCKPFEPSMRKYTVEKVAKVANPFEIM
jgi:hypothetical protein